MDFQSHLVQIQCDLIQKQYGGIQGSLMEEITRENTHDRIDSPNEDITIIVYDVN